MKRWLIVVLFGALIIGLIAWNYNRIEQEFKVWLDIPCFEVEELCFSWTALCYSIDNTPENAGVEENLQALIDNVLIPARREYGKYIKVRRCFV